MARRWKELIKSSDMKTFFITLPILCICFNCVIAQNTEPSNITKTHWLIGTWKGIHNGAPFYETWRERKDKSLICYAIEVSNGDTTVRKNSEIHVSGNNIVFADPNIFNAARIMNNEMVFEINDPKIGSSRLIWLRTNDDHWWAILQFPKVTAHYDLVRDQQMDKAISSKLPKDI